jgi:hypothetical protein
MGLVAQDPLMSFINRLKVVQNASFKLLGYANVCLLYIKTFIFCNWCFFSEINLCAGMISLMFTHERKNMFVSVAGV